MTLIKSIGLGLLFSFSLLATAGNSEKKTPAIDSEGDTHPPEPLLNFTHPNNPLPIDAEDPTEVTTGDRFAQACQWISAVFFQGPPFDDDENDSGNFASMAAGLLNSRTLY